MTTRLTTLISQLDGYETVAGDPSSVQIEHITLDSRTAGPGSLFIAIPGTSSDGTRFVPDALESGASAVVVQKDHLGQLDLSSLSRYKAPIIAVDDARESAGLLASAFFRHPSTRLELIGITGTNGKTTTAFILKAILEEAGRRPGLMGTVEYSFQGLSQKAALTTPGPVAINEFLDNIARQGADCAVMEVSSHALHQKRVAGLRFKSAIFTNLSHDHLDYHGNEESYFTAKASLFLEHRPECAVINLDDPWGRRLTEEMGKQGLDAQGTRIITYGLEKRAQLRPQRLFFSIEGISFLLSLPDGSMAEIKSRLIGRHNLYNILAAAAAAHGLGIDIEAIKSGIERLTHVPGRLEPVRSPAGTLALVDYAHTPDAVDKVLSCLRELSPARIITVIGCGGDRDREKRPKMAQMAWHGSDILFITSDNPRTEDPRAIISDMTKGLSGEEIEADASKELQIVEDRRQAIFQAADRLRPGDILLVAGKGHEDYQIIGTERSPFDDRKVLKEAFDQLDGLRRRFFNAEGLCKAIGAEMHGPDPARKADFFSVSTDTRTLRKGELFWALSGENFDGNAFVEKALEMGAAGAVAQDTLKNRLGGLEGLLGARPVLLVRDTLKALGDFASSLRAGLDLKVVAITGSCGKTTTKEILAAICSKRLFTLKTHGNLNNLIGAPLTLLRARPWHDVAILELGTNRPGEIARLAEIASADISLITCIRPAHLEGLGGIEEVAREKLALFQATRQGGTLIINLDDEWICRALTEGQLHGHRLIGFGLKEGRRHWPPESILEDLYGLVEVLSWSVDLDRAGDGPRYGLRLEMEIRASQESKRFLLNSPMVGRAAAINIAAAAAAATAIGLGPSDIQKGLEGLELPGGRLKLSEADRFLILDDCYNANPASMEMALETLAALPGIGQRIAVLGDMMELGGDEARFHEELGQKAARFGIERLVTVGKRARHIAAGACREGMDRGCVISFEDTKALCRALAEKGPEALGINGTSRSPAILFKASRAVGLERAIQGLRRAAGTSQDSGREK